MSTTSSKNPKSFRAKYVVACKGKTQSHQPCTCMKKLHNMNNIINLKHRRVLSYYTYSKGRGGILTTKHKKCRRVLTHIL
jgi:hypothetical protein